MNKRIVILPGDGIGKEVTTEGKSVLKKIAEIFVHEFEFDEAVIGHDAIEATGTTCAPKSTPAATLAATLPLVAAVATASQ